MKLSIVSTLYRSSSYIAEFCSRAGAIAKATVGDDYEIILVNDGSPDDSLAKAVAVREQDDRVVIVDLSRNFGHHKAILAGLHQSQGDFVYLLDVDLEDQPEWLAMFWQELNEPTSSPDVVYGTQASRTGGAFSAFGGWAFYKAFNRLSEIQVPENPTTARLMRRAYVDAVCQLKEANVYMEGTFAWTGFRQLGIPVEIVHDQSSSTYTLRKRLQLLVTSITSFSSAPLKLNCIQMDHLSTSPENLVQILQAHYLRGATTQLYRILGSLDFMGNPISLVSSLGSGVRDFFYEPTLGAVQVS